MDTIMQAARRGLPFSGELLIDAHCHYGSHHSTVVPYNTNEAIIAEMDRIGVQKACFSTLEIGIVGDNDLHNQALSGFVAQHPQRILGYATVNTNYKDSLLAQYERYFGLGLRLGVKLHTYRQPHCVADECFAPLLEALSRRRAILLDHDFGEVGPLEEALRAYPDIRFLAAHMDGQRAPQYIPLLKKYDNFFLGTTATLAYGQLADNVRQIGSEKIIYGSDLVILDSSFGFGPVAFSRITLQEKRNILGLNMKAMLDDIVMA